LTGFFYDGNMACAACSSTCLTCSGAATSQCTSCPVGYYLSTTSMCVNCMLNCVDCASVFNNVTNTSSVQCSRCSTGYSLINNTCRASPGDRIAVSEVQGVIIICPAGCKSCTNASVCTSCHTGFVPFNNTCRMCHESCATCNWNNTS